MTASFRSRRSHKAADIEEESVEIGTSFSRAYGLPKCSTRAHVAQRIHTLRGNISSLQMLESLSLPGILYTYRHTVEMADHGYLQSLHVAGSGRVGLHHRHHASPHIRLPRRPR